MQKALENLAQQVTASAAKVVVDIGTSAGQARNAIDSAFNLSALPGLGWTLQHVDGALAIDAWLSTLAIANTGILYIPTAGNSSGDLTAAELAAINTHANDINNFVAGASDPTQGGGLFSMGESDLPGSYGWLTTLIPGIVFTDAGGGGIASDITLTAAGTAAFPGLTNADLAGADPWHGYFSGNLGGLQVLGVAPFSNQQRNVIIGGGAGTVIACGQPNQPPCPTVPEPASLSLLAAGFAGLVAARARRRANA